MKHVLLVTDLFPHRGRPHHGGSVAALCDELGRHARVTVLSPRYFFPIVPPGNWLNFYRGQPSRDGAARYPITPAWPHAFYTLAQGFSMAAAFTLPAWRAGPFDVVHAFGAMPSGMPAAWLARVLRAPLLVTATGSDVTYFPTVRHVRPWVRGVLRRSSAVTAVSRDLCRVVGALGAEAEFIPMGIPAMLADAAAASGPREPATVLFLGRLETWKGIQHLVAAMRDVPGARLVVIGAGSRSPHLRGAELLGALPTPEVHAWLRRATILCMPSEREGWPVTALEAMACGLPVVATRVGGLPEILEHHGILCDRADLAPAIREALARRWDRPALVEHARTYTWDRIAGRYAELYERLAK